MTTASQNQADAKYIVIAAIDFWTGAAEVLATAANLARAPGSELHVIHVLPDGAAGASHGDRALRFSNFADETRAKLSEMAASVPDSVKRIDLHVRVGRADVEIGQLASDLGADLIVVGTHAHSTLDRALLGSVAESLVRRAPCPVMAYRPKSIRAWEQIAPPCPDCLAVRKSSARSRLWCDRHSEHHQRAHTYSEVPEGYGIGSQTFR